MRDVDESGLAGLDRERARPWIPFLLAVAVHAVSLAWGLRLYDGLPEVIPTHWGPGGQPDDWDEKSPGTVFMPLIVAAGTTAMMAFMGWLAPMFMQPSREPSNWARFRHEGARRATVAILGWTALLVALLTGYLSVSGWTTPEQVSARWPFLLFMVALAAAIVLPYRRWQRWADERAADAGASPTPQEAAEDRLWLAGGIYNDPDEPRAWVPKREGHGTGLTINVGHRKGRAIVIGFVLVVVGLPVALIFLLG